MGDSEPPAAHVHASKLRSIDQPAAAKPTRGSEATTSRRGDDIMGRNPTHYRFVMSMNAYGRPSKRAARDQLPCVAMFSLGFEIPRASRICSVKEEKPAYMYSTPGYTTSHPSNYYFFKSRAQRAPRFLQVQHTVCTHARSSSSSEPHPTVTPKRVSITATKVCITPS